MIASLELKNFRCIKEASFDFDSGVTIIIGPNASGKTSILEAILIAAQGKSYRAGDINLVNKNKEWSKIEIIQTDDTKRIIKLKKAGEKIERNFQIDGKKFSRLSPRLKLPVVIFEPNQLQNLSTSPELRRSLIDGLLEQISQEFYIAKKSYNRALAQRNNLLKKPDQARKNVFAWNVRLSELGSKIVQERLRIIEEINQQISKLYSELSGAKHSLEIVYETKIKGSNYSNGLLKELENSIEKDLDRGFTTAGPHRDDIAFLLDGSNIKETGSRGEVRTTLLAFKVIEAQIIEKSFEDKPILLLDDVLGELDGYRRKTLANLLADYQTFITTTDADIVKNRFKKAHLLAIT